MSKPLITSSRVTLRGYQFITHLIERREVIVIDPNRGNKEVMRAKLPEDARRYASALDNFQKKLARMILDAYKTQHIYAALEVEEMSDLKLTTKEMKAGVGYRAGAISQSLEGAYRGAVARAVDKNK